MIKFFYSEPNSTILITIECDIEVEGHVTFSIKDQMRGINENDQNAFFEPQVQLLLLLLRY